MNDDTPIFDSVMADQGQEIFPYPVETHEQFMARHGYPEFLERAEAILSASVGVPIAKKRPK